MAADFKANVSVRELVEFVLRSGDIDNTKSHADADAMQEGVKIHRKIQKSMGPSYRAEVSLKHELLLTRGETEEEGSVLLTVEGRADGIFTDFVPGKNDGVITIDEIKSTYMSLKSLTEPVQVHLAQAKCYAYIYALQNDLHEIGVRMTYASIETEEILRFEHIYTLEELFLWFESLVKEYSRWLFMEADWHETRNNSIKELKFPFEYRSGQKELVGSVYKTITRGRLLFIEAPTGVGKTISTVFPAVWAVGEKKSSKIFYLTAKNIARSVAENTFSLLNDRGLKFRYVSLTAKEKICVLDKPSCNPKDCERACGHFDRVNECVFDLVTHEENINRDLILQYADKYRVCPFEMCLDVSLWADAVVCDYNYVFDPRAALKRFFSDEKKNDYILLIDEAHNLPDRAREMYSADIVKEDFLRVKKLIQGKSRKMEKYLEACNKCLLEYKRACDDFQIWEDADRLYNALINLYGVYEDFLDENPGLNEGREEILTLYFNIMRFMQVYENMDEAYRIYTDYLPSGDFRIRLLCMEPAKQLRERMDRCLSSILFSATLLPMNYYKEQLGGLKDDYAVYVPSPFSVNNRLIMIGNDISTKYTNRGEREYTKILEYIKKFVNFKVGNYLIFFSSYKMMEEVLLLWDQEDINSSDILTNNKLSIKSGLNCHAKVVVQKKDMNESDKEEFLSEFEENPKITLVGFAVMGGAFSEGIDLVGDRLSGAVIVGCGLPTVGYEKELFRRYFDDKSDNGFEYAYLYPGMNKVMQSAGRVIRTVDDVGAILLLDERFEKRQYTELFPREWVPYEIVNRNTVTSKLKEFYDGKQ